MSVPMLTQWRLLPPLTSTVKSSMFMFAHFSPLSLAARLHRCHANHSNYINNGWTFSSQTSYIAIVYLSPNKTYDTISSDNLVGEMEEYGVIIKEFVIYKENLPQGATGPTSGWRDISYAIETCPQLRKRNRELAD